MSRTERIKALKQLKRARPMGELETLCIERQLRDLSNAEKRGLIWDEAEAQRAVKFFSLLTHWKGPWAGKPVTLEPWQEHCQIAPLFGWRHKDGTRRFREGYDEEPRKNGKTTKAAGIALFGLTADREEGAEIYAAATKRDQARILFRDSTKLLRRSRALRNQVELLKHSVTCPRLNASFVPLSSEGNSLDGLNPHMCLIDELHAHKTREVYDVLSTAAGARSQPLLYCITTAGFDRQTVCWERHEYAVKLLKQEIEDDSFFAFIACADDGDDFRDPHVWAKANPNLGISVQLDYLQRQCLKAIHSPSFENTFRRLHLNQWTEQQDRWLRMQLWDRCMEQYIAQDLQGEICFGGLDLSKTRDTTSLVLVFKIEGEFYLLPFFWIPAEGAQQREREDGVPYSAWARAGQLFLCDGDAVDYRQIKEVLRWAKQRFGLRRMAYDPYNALMLALELGDEGFEMVEFGQTWRNMADPTTEFEKLVTVQKIHHNNHPVLSWQAQNVAIKRNLDGLIRPKKPMSQDAKKIDGIVASIMGLALAMRPDDTYRSVYEDRGFAPLD
jgi:phage terminase large subunit-like protein